MVLDKIDTSSPRSQIIFCVLIFFLKWPPTTVSWAKSLHLCPQRSTVAYCMCVPHRHQTHYQVHVPAIHLLVFTDKHFVWVLMHMANLCRRVCTHYSLRKRICLTLNESARGLIVTLQISLPLRKS